MCISGWILGSYLLISDLGSVRVNVLHFYMPNDNIIMTFDNMIETSFLKDLTKRF